MAKTVEVDFEVLKRMRVALSRAEQFFCARDDMNAEIHMAEVRMSPLTQCVALSAHEALELVSGVAAKDVTSENERYRKGFKLLWDMAVDYKTPWVCETLRYNPLFASLYEELVQR